MSSHCEACLGEGKVLVFIPATWTEPAWYDTTNAPCPHCYGTGFLGVEAEPLTLEDLDAMAGATHEAQADNPERHRNPSS